MEAQFAMGMLPFLIILSMLSFALYAMIYGLGANQLAIYVGITAIIVAVIGLVWRRLAYKSPQWRMGSQASIVLFVVAFLTFFVIAPKIQSMLPTFQVVPLLALGGFDASSPIVQNSLSMSALLILLLVGTVIVFLKRPHRRPFR